MMADESGVRLARLRAAMVRMRREGRVPEFEALAEAYEALKVQRMEAAEVEQREAVRARRVAERAERPSPGPRRVWRLPRGFSSPLAAQRAVRAVAEPLVPDSRRPALSPWRGSHPMAARVWRPGR